MCSAASVIFMDKVGWIYTTDWETLLLWVIFVKYVCGCPNRFQRDGVIMLYV